MKVTGLKHRVFGWCVAGALAGTLVWPGLLLAQTPDFATLGKCVVSIRVERSKQRPPEEAAKETGTGILIQVSPGVLRILTAQHVVHDAATIQIGFSSDRALTLPAQALPDSSDALDLAVLEAHPTATFHLPAGLHPLAWAANAELKASEHVWTLNGDGEPVPNNIVRLSHSGNAQQFEYTQVSVGEGYSGAPVFNDSGQLIGIHDEETSRSDYKLSVAVKMQSAMETLDALGYATAPMNVLTQSRPGTPGLAPRPQNTFAASAVPSQPATQSGAAKTVQVWRNTTNNQLYVFRDDGAHMYITRKDGAVIGDLALTQDKKGGTKYVGTSSLSNCSGGGYTEIDVPSATRIDGRAEQKSTNGQCMGANNLPIHWNLGGFSLRQMAPLAFIPEP